MFASRAFLGEGGPLGGISVTDETLSGASRDPVALLEQLIGHVANIRGDMVALKGDMVALSEKVDRVQQEVQDVRTDLKQEIQDVRTELKQEIQDVRTELKQEIHKSRQDSSARPDGIRSDVRQFLEGTEKREEALRTRLEESFSRKSYLYVEKFREEWEPRMFDLERRMSNLEEAERLRKQEQKA